MLRHSTLVFLLCLISVPVASAQVTEAQSISDEFLPSLDGRHGFGLAITSLGDLDGAGPAVNALAVATDGDHAVWILFMKDERTVLDRHKIDVNTPALKGRLEGDTRFGRSVANIGDLDGDTVNDLAVGDVSGRGAIWILFLTDKGRVKDVRKIDADSHPDLAELKDDDQFGQSITTLGDLDGAANPGVMTLAVGAQFDDYETLDRSDAGAVWVLSIDAEGTVLSTRTINGEKGKLKGPVNSTDQFGASVAAFDLPGDGVTHYLAVGASRLNKLFVLALVPDPDSLVRVEDFLLITENEGGFEGDLGGQVSFGSAVANLGDLDGAGPSVTALAVGAPQDFSFGNNAGAVWVVFLGPDTTKVGVIVTHEDKLAAQDLTPREQDQLGTSVASVTTSEGSLVLYAGAYLDDDDSDSDSEDDQNSGAVWVLPLSLTTDRTTVAIDQEVSRLSRSKGDVTLKVEEEDFFGRAVANLGDLDANGPSVRALAVGAPGDDGTDRAPIDNAGAVWVLFLDADISVTDSQKISAADGGFTGSLSAGDGFGTSAASLGDLDGDGLIALAVGTPGDDDGAGAVWVVFLNGDGTVNTQQKISATEGGFTGSLSAGDGFGTSAASLGDLDGDGANDLAVGAPGDDDGADGAGAVWVLFLNDDGTVKTQQKISSTVGEFTGSLIREGGSGTAFGAAVTSLGDLNNDGVIDLAVGATDDDDGAFDAGAVWVLFLNDNGTVKDQKKISATEGNFVGTLNTNDRFGSALVNLGDLYIPDMVRALAVGAPGDDQGVGENTNNTGAAWVLYLQADGTVAGHQRIRRGFGTSDDFKPKLKGAFGSSLARLEDPDGADDLIVGAPGSDDTGGDDTGAIWLMFQDFNRLPEVDELEPSSAMVAADIIVKAKITEDNDEIEEASLHYRNAAALDFFKGEMALEGEKWQGKIFDVFATERGTEYFIAATDTNGGTTRAPATGVFSIQIEIPNGLRKDDAQPFGTSSTAYRLISVPLDLENKDPASVLLDDLGEPDNSEWRLFEPVGETPADYLEYTGSSGMEMASGKAFWLIVKEIGKTIGTGPGKTVPTDESFQVPLETGWNVFGNPFNFDIPISNLTLGSDAPLDLHFYEDAWSTVADTAMIVPFEGYAIFVNDPDTLFIDPDLSSAPENTAAAKAAHADGTLWSIRIRARSGLARDVDNVAAVVPEATATWDRLDRAEPPVIGDFVSVYFAHPEWKKATTRYSTDARPTPSDGAVWPIEIVTARRDAVHLTFEGLADVPPAYEAWLVDDILGITQDLRQTASYTVGGGGAADPRPLRLVVGRPGFLEGATEAAQALPERFELFPNFPNPFNPSTTIRYGLPEAAPVSLVVYNMLGQKVATLSGGAEQPAGYHAVVWDGRSDAGTAVASGVYFVRMRAGRFVQTQKMIMVR